MKEEVDKTEELRTLLMRLCYNEKLTERLNMIKLYKLDPVMADEGVLFLPLVLEDAIASIINLFKPS